MLRAIVVAAILALLPVGPPAAAQQGGLVTQPSAHSVRSTIDRFTAAVREAEWVIFAEVDHTAAAQASGLSLRPRTVVFFGNPRAGTAGMAATPTLALDLPLRVLVWENDAGQVFVTRSTGEDIAERVFARHGVAVPPPQRAGTEAMLERLVRHAVQ